MAWRGSSSPKDRAFACLPYLLPLIEVVIFGTPLFARLPILGTIYLTLLAPFIAVYSFLGSLIPYADLIIFFALFLLVVRNERILHFIRYNTMQSILISIALSLCSLMLQLLGFLGSDLSAFPLFGEVIFNLIFLAVVSASVYSIFQCIRGRYPEIPIISEAVYTQVR
jgi:uncharacterized membrane protein